MQDSSRAHRYAQIKLEVSRPWRALIPQRDSRQRCACGVPAASVDVAHVTPALLFVEEFGGAARGLPLSYRWDNLVTLCAVCHEASHREWQYLWPKDRLRLRAVEYLFEAIRRRRGWTMPRDAPRDTGQFRDGRMVAISSPTMLELREGIARPYLAQPQRSPRRRR